MHSLRAERRKQSGRNSRCAPTPHSALRAPLHHSPLTTHHSPPRPGFSLVELLTVITIISILTGIIYVVLADNVTNARIEATKATIIQLDAALQDRIEAFHRLKFKSQAQRFEGAFNAANSPNTIPPNVAEIVIRKVRFRGAFPQRLEDLWGLDGTADTADDDALWRVWRRKTNTAAAPWGRSDYSADHESSLLLYLVLTESSVFGLPPLNLDNVNRSHIGTQTVNGNEMFEFVDDWGNPLRFYNWPTRLIRFDGEQGTSPPVINADITRSLFLATASVLVRRAPQPPPGLATLPYNVFSHPLNQDPDDQYGALTAYLNTDPGGPGLLEILGATAPPPPPQAVENRFHTLDTYHTPLIVSPGPDGTLGLHEPSLPADAPLRLAQVLDEDTTAAGVQNDSINDNLTNR